ncbi:MAG: pilus assembly protein PilP [Pseudomonadota bacterium]|jgi:type IV pilus assembly protein PilP|uniref:pilus assembly protein PilP n=1 Tax=Sulfuricystis thermophila TaxID=2496847 RepID=UPI001035EAF9|nr:pilus assembly protein PilP [Sulfuricystis thermophila]MDI6750242.1 pilus assembly protein PilP [Rhodocyclaceae bacterium]
MRTLGIYIAALLTLAACAERGHDEIRQWMEESSRDLKGGIPPLPELKPFPVVSYEANDLVDPFNPSRIEPERKGAGGANKPDFDRPREQLENYPLESISFIGVVDKTKSKTKRAIVQADGVVYQVGVGNYLGQNFGRIVAITPTEIVLKEIVQDPSGQTSDWVEREMTLQLKDGAQGKESKK